MTEILISNKQTVEYIAKITVQVKSPTALSKVIGRRGANELKSWFTQRNQVPNKLGGRRTNFWAQVRSSVQNPVTSGDGRQIRISINHPPFAQKVFGGSISAKVAGALTIPKIPEAYGRTAAVFEKETGIRLFLYRSKVSSFAALAYTVGERTGKGGDQKLVIAYLLAPRVNQKPDPLALPPQDQFNAALMAEADAFLARQIAADNPSNPNT